MDEVEHTRQPGEGIRGEGLRVGDLARAARGRVRWSIEDGARARMEAARAALVAAAEEPGRCVYGVNTGFGRLASQRIDAEDVIRLQENLIASHTSGVGSFLDEEVVRGAILLRANSLAKGYSGVRPCVVVGLLALLNERIHPLVPRFGSLGASGDLIPLAHVASVLVGRGRARVEDRDLDGAAALAEAGLTPLQLEAKEGLALINGTPFMTAAAGLAVGDAQRLLVSADIIGALTIAGLSGRTEAYDAAIQEVRPHPGQGQVAANLRRLLDPWDGGEAVQDAYSLRCVPQIHGAVRDAISHARRVVEVEMNAATDNPLVFPARGAVLSGGNFHGEPVALVADYANLAMTELGVLSERRVNRLLHPDLNRGLPAFLSAHPGLESGLMIAQYAAAALVAQCRGLAHPASLDSISVSGDQEDHVSMGMHAALHLRETVHHVAGILAIELLCACEALEHARVELPAGILAAHRAVRACVDRVRGDEPLTDRIAVLTEQVRDGALERAVTAAVGPLQ